MARLDVHRAGIRARSHSAEATEVLIERMATVPAPRPNPSPTPTALAVAQIHPMTARRTDAGWPDSPATASPTPMAPNQMPKQITAERPGRSASEPHGWRRRRCARTAARPRTD